MPRSDRLPFRGNHARAALFGVALGLFAWGTAARAGEYASYHLLDLEHAQAARSIAVLTVPAGWMPGDPAAVVVIAQAAPEAAALRTALIADLAAAGAAVAELVVLPQAPAGALRADIDQLLGVLVAGVGAGQVVAFGMEADIGGPAALAAADPGRYGTEGDDAPRLTAAAALGAGCRTATPMLDDPEEWRLHAVFEGEALAQAPEDGLPDHAAALRCALALVPAGGAGAR